MCNRDLREKDVEQVWDGFSQSWAMVCRHCGFRLIRLIGFRFPYMHGFRKVL